MIERLSKRYQLSDDVTSQILRAADDKGETGNFCFEDEKYSVEVKIRENDIDICLFCSLIMTDTA